MTSMLAWWQMLPLSWDPTIFTFGFFSLRWYAVLYFLGVGASVFLLARRRYLLPVFQVQENWNTLVLRGLWGVLIGARLGYVLFYGDAVYWTEPWRIVSPYDFSTGTWTGIRGMSFFGGALGLLLVLWYEARRLKLPFLSLADWLVPVIPAALFFGRIGNFLNQELIGRAARVPWGVYFPSDPITVRHPSQLYEAIGEGLALFFILHWLGRRQLPRGFLSACFLIGYGGLRFGLEFFRAPDHGAHFLLSYFTLGQVLSGSMLGCGLWLAWARRGLWYTTRAKTEQS